MNADDFSLKARRTTRIPLRIPLILVIREAGNPRSVDAWTMIVNIHGARIECRQQLKSEEELLIQVPFTGKTQKGKVVWGTSEANKNGNYEFGLELEKPGNMWGVGFPPTDWQPNAAAAAAAIAELRPEGAGSSPGPVASDPSPPQSSVKTSPESQAAEPEDPFTVADEPMAAQVPVPAETPVSVAASDAESISLNADLSSWTSDPKDPAFPSLSRDGAFQTPASEAEVAVKIPEPALETTAAEDAAAVRTLGSAARASHASRQAPRVFVDPVPAPAKAAEGWAGQVPATDRLSAIINELVESALQARLLGLVERLGARVEARIAEMETSALARVERQIQSAASSRSEFLERQALDMVERRRQLSEQELQKFLEEAETEAQRRHEAFLDASRQAMRKEMAELVMSSNAQLQQEATELLSATQTSIRHSIEQELPTVEKEFVQRCHSQAKETLAGGAGRFSQLVSERMQEAGGSLNQAMEKTVEENTTRFAAGLESSSEQLRSQFCAEFQRQIGQAETQAREAFRQHMVSELAGGRQLWIQQAQRELQELAEQNLRSIRRCLSRMMGQLGESLLQQPFPQGGAPEPLLPAGQGEAVITERFAEAPVGPCL